MRGRNILVASVFVGVSGAAWADPAPICADRPGKATGTCTVPAGRWQVEAGIADWTLEKAAGERDTSLVLGETTVKYGVNGASDIEVDVTPWQRSASRVGGVRSSARGIGDLTVSYKQRLSGADAPVQVTAKPFVKAPTAPHSLGNGKWEGGLLVPVGYAIPKTPFSIALTPEVDLAADADGHGHHAAMAQVVGVGWAASDRLNL